MSMPTSAARPADQLPSYLKENLTSLQGFTRQLDKVSQEVRDIEASLSACGICVNFIYPTVRGRSWIRYKGEPGEYHYSNTSVLAWMEVGDKYRLIQGDAEQAYKRLPDGNPTLRTTSDAFIILQSKPLIETKAQVRLTESAFLPDFVKSLTEHVQTLTARWNDDDWLSQT